MTQIALIIRHLVRPGLRDDVRRVWEARMAPAIDANPGHLAYFYCFDDSEPDAITAFQVYDSIESSREFLETGAYASYLRDVEPLLSAPPQITPLTPVWMKQA
jgi:quinol monooxygenase YgiN